MKDRNMLARSVKLRTLGTVIVAVLAVVTSSGHTATVATAPGGARAPAWVWPVDEPHPIVRAFEAPETPYSAGHRGIDISAPAGATVRAPAGGIIHFSGFVVNRYVVSIDHGGGILSSFEPVLPELAEGTIVVRGQKIGALQSGHCRAPCLHMGVRLHGQYISPLNYLGGIPRSVLLPTREIP